MALYAWPPEPVCLLDVPDDPAGWGWLTYVAPDGVRASLPVTRGPSRGPDGDRPTTWHVEIPEPGVAITTPSIKVTTTRPTPPPDGPMREVEVYHSPYRVRWQVADSLDEEP